MNQKHNLRILVVMIAVLVLFVPNVSGRKRATTVPQATNTVNSIRFSELNLEATDYTIMKTITAEAKIVYETNRSGDKIKIKEANSEFLLNYERDDDGITLKSFEGVVRVGYLTNDDLRGDPTYYYQPESLARSLAIYRLINQANANGADGVVEPIISTNVEQVGNALVFLTTVSAKIVRIKVK